MLKYIIVAIIIVCLYCLFAKYRQSSVANVNASEGTLQGEQREPMSVSTPLSKAEASEPEVHKQKFVMLQDISSKTPSFLNWAVVENPENPDGAKTYSLTYFLESPKSNKAQNTFIFDEDATISENRIVLRCPSEIKTHFILEAKESHYLLKTDFNGSGHTHYFCNGAAPRAVIMKEAMVGFPNDNYSNSELIKFDLVPVY